MGNFRYVKLPEGTGTLNETSVPVLPVLLPSSTPEEYAKIVEICRDGSPISQRVPILFNGNMLIEAM